MTRILIGFILAALCLCYHPPGAHAGIVAPPDAGIASVASSAAPAIALASSAALPPVDTSGAPSWDVIVAAIGTVAGVIALVVLLLSFAINKLLGTRWPWILDPVPQLVLAAIKVGAIAVIAAAATGKAVTPALIFGAVVSGVGVKLGLMQGKAATSPAPSKPTNPIDVIRNFGRPSS